MNLHHFAHLHLFASTGQGVLLMLSDGWTAGSPAPSCSHILQIATYFNAKSIILIWNHWFFLQPHIYFIQKKESNLPGKKCRFPFSKNHHTFHIKSPVKFLQTLAQGNISPPQRYPSRSPAFDSAWSGCDRVSRLVMSDSCIMS